MSPLEPARQTLADHQAPHARFPNKDVYHTTENKFTGGIASGTGSVVLKIARAGEQVDSRGAGQRVEGGRHRLLSPQTAQSGEIVLVSKLRSGSESPEALLVKRAENIIPRLPQEVQESWAEVRPVVCAITKQFTPAVSTVDDELVLSWRQGPNLLELYLTGDDVAWVLAWGPNMWDDMDDGSIGPELSVEFLALWNRYRTLPDTQA